MSQVVSRTQMWSRNVCRVMAWTRETGLVPFIGYKGVNAAACPPGGNPDEVGSLTASSLPLFLFGATLRTEVQNRLRSAFKKKRCYEVSLDHRWMLNIYWNRNVIKSTFFHFKFFTLDYLVGGTTHTHTHIYIYFGEKWVLR